MSPQKATTCLGEMNLPGGDQLLIYRSGHIGSAFCQQSIIVHSEPKMLPKTLCTHSLPASIFLLWGLTLILEVNSSLRYLSFPHPFPGPDYALYCPPRRFKVSEHTDVSACDRHTPFTRVIQTSLFKAINDILKRVYSGFWDVPQSVSGHPQQR